MLKYRIPQIVTLTLSFSQLYFNLFLNLAGQKREERIRLRIDKESFFEVYKLNEEMN